MRTMNGWRRSGMWSGEGLFGPSSFLSGASLSQAAGSGDWITRGRIAVAQWNSLLGRIANIKDDAERGRLLAWMGRTDTPGSNTERYTAVLQDVTAGDFADAAIAERRVGQLEGAVSDLTSLVENAEKTYGTTSYIQEPGELSKPGAGLTVKGVAVGLVAVLALLVVPLVLKD